MRTLGQWKRERFVPLSPIDPSRALVALWEAERERMRRTERIADILTSGICGTIFGVICGPWIVALFI